MTASSSITDYEFSNKSFGRKREFKVPVCNKKPFVVTVDNKKL